LALRDAGVVFDGFVARRQREPARAHSDAGDRRGIDRALRFKLQTQLTERSLKRAGQPRADSARTTPDSVTPQKNSASSATFGDLAVSRSAQRRTTT
jgi:hypothetical protein